jgi:hypothetical protein
MFDNRDKQLADLETAHADFVETLRSLSADDLLKPLGDWTPRDIAAHFIIEKSTGGSLDSSRLLTAKSY